MGPSLGKAGQSIDAMMSRWPPFLRPDARSQTSTHAQLMQDSSPLGLMVITAISGSQWQIVILEVVGGIS